MKNKKTQSKLFIGLFSLSILSTSCGHTKSDLAMRPGSSTNNSRDRDIESNSRDKDRGCQSTAWGAAKAAALLAAGGIGYTVGSLTGSSCNNAFGGSTNSSNAWGMDNSK